MRDALVEQRRGNLDLDLRGVAVAKSRDQIVVGGQLRLGLAALAVRDALVAQRRGNLYLELRGVAVAKTRNQIVVGGQLRLGLTALAVRDALKSSARATWTWTSGVSLSPNRTTRSS